MKQCTEQQFLKDVAAHQMTSLLDNGVHRCLRFASKENSWYLHFTLTTWPGHLCISGDMGCFVFTRVEDMFEFFRSRPDTDDALYINPDYWGEKCVAVDRSVGRDCYDEDKFSAAVRDRFDAYEFPSRAAKKECWENIKAQVLIAENEYEAHSYTSKFEHEGFEFTDFWEKNLRSYTFQYIWCCYAIAWAVKQYDQHLAGGSR